MLCYVHLKKDADMQQSQIKCKFTYQVNNLDSLLKKKKA